MPGPDTTDGRVLRAQAQRRETRAQLIAAARRVFCREGYHAASIQEILSEAGVSRGTFYAHFEGKQAAFDAVLQGFVSDLAAAIAPVDVSAEATFTDQLIANFARILALLEEDADLTRLLLVQAHDVGPDANAHVQRFHEGVLALITRSITVGTELGLVRPGDIRLRAVFALGAIKEAVTRVLIGDEATDRDALARELLTYLLRGFLR